MIDISSENEEVQALVKKAGFRFKLWLVAWSVVYFVLAVFVLNAQDNPAAGTIIVLTAAFMSAFASSVLQLSNWLNKLPKQDKDSS